MIPPSPAWASKPVEFDALRKPVESTVEERFSLDPVILDEADGEDHENMDALGDIAANGMSNSDILSLLNAAGLDEEEDHEEGEGGGGVSNGRQGETTSTATRKKLWTRR